MVPSSFRFRINIIDKNSPIKVYYLFIMYYLAYLSQTTRKTLENKNLFPTLLTLDQQITSCRIKNSFIRLFEITSKNSAKNKFRLRYT